MYDSGKEAIESLSDLIDVVDEVGMQASVHSEEEMVMVLPVNQCMTDMWVVGWCCVQVTDAEIRSSENYRTLGQ